MKTYARIHGGTVAELIAEMLDESGNEIAIADRFHPDIAATIVDASAAPDVAQGWTFDGKTFAAPVAPVVPLDTLKARKLAELAAACALRMATIKAGYPQDEISTWDKQESEAREYTRTGGTAATPLLSALSSARGVSLSDLASRVIAKADAFATVSGGVIGKRQRYEDQVAAATDAAGVAAIAWVD